MAAGSLLPAGYETLEDANGVTVPGGLIWKYAAGTTTPLATYTDVALLVPNTNPIIADGSGRWVAFAAPGTGFKLVLETPAIPPAHGATIKTCDNIAAPLTDSTAGATGGATVISDNTTGIGNNFVLPGRTKDTLWVWNGSADLTLTGIAGGSQGDRITIKNMSTVVGRRVVFPHMSAASTNPFYNLITVGAGALVLASGWISFVLVGGTWVQTDHDQGAPFLRPFSAGDFSAQGSTWTMTAVTRDAVLQRGKAITHWLDATGTVGVATTVLQVTPPANMSYVTVLDAGACNISINSVFEMGFLQSNTTLLSIIRSTFAAFPAGASVRLLGQFTAEVK
jgi:hypothetical protein